MDFSPAGFDKPVIAVCAQCGAEAQHINQVSWHHCPSQEDGADPDGYWVNPT